MDSKVKKIIEDNIQYIEDEDWKGLSKKIGPDKFVSIIPTLAEADIQCYSSFDNKKLEDISSLCYYIAGIDGFMDGVGETALWVQEGVGESAFSVEEIKDFAQWLGFQLFSTQMGWLPGSDDYLILSPKATLQEYVYYQNSNFDEYGLQVDDFIKII